MRHRAPGTVPSLRPQLTKEELTAARLIKIDVEGSEAAAVRGLAPVLHRLRTDIAERLDVPESVGADPFPRLTFRPACARLDAGRLGDVDLPQTGTRFGIAVCSTLRAVRHSAAESHSRMTPTRTCSALVSRESVSAVRNANRGGTTA